MDKSLAITDPQEVYTLASRIDNLIQLGKVLLDSGLMPAWIKTPQAAVAVIMKGMELRVGPMAALSLIYPINGVMAVAPQLGLALARRTGELEDLKVEDNGETCTVTIKRRGQSPVTTTFSQKDAERITFWDDRQRAEVPLSQKRNWKMYPKEMRFWRAVGSNLRITFSDAVHGLVLPDEAGAVTDQDGKPIEIVGKPEIISPETEYTANASIEPTAKQQGIDTQQDECDVDNDGDGVNIVTDEVGAAEICRQLRETARKIVGGKPSDLEVSRLAAVINSAIRDAYPEVDPASLDFLRYKVYTMVSGINVQSGAELPRGLVVAMLSRWSDTKAKRGYASNQQASVEIGTILKAFSTAEVAQAQEAK